MVEVSTIEDVYRITGWEYFDIVRLRNSETNEEADMWVDDVGLLNGSPINMLASCMCIEILRMSFHVRGDVIIFGHDGEGETTNYPQWVVDWIIGNEIVISTVIQKTKEETTSEG